MLKMTASSQEWRAEGSKQARRFQNPELNEDLRKQIKLAFEMHSKRTTRQSKAWVDGWLSVVGYDD